MEKSMTDIVEIAEGIVFGSANKELMHNNANKDSSRVSVQKNMIAGEVAKLAAHKYVPEHVLTAHNKGEIHFHDMDESPLYPMYNCCLVDLKGMLENGFKMGNADIETPKSISTACAVTAQIIAQVACAQYGGVSLNRLDEVLAPYVQKTYEKELSFAKQFMDNDKAVVAATKRTLKEVEDATQGLEYEVNTLFTSQGQTPFVTFGFGLGTSWQARAVQEGILKTRIKGLGKQGRTAIFPKLVFMMDENINIKKGDPNYDIKQLAIECAGKRNYPDVLNMPMLRKSGGGCAPMGCRSFLHYWEDDNGVPVWDGRNNLGVVSVNLPHIAMESEGNVEKFWEILDQRLEVCKDGLMARIDRLRGVKAKVAPILYCEGALGFRLDPEDEIMQVFENGRASISLGYIGMNEMCNAIFGTEEHMLTSAMKQEFALKVTEYMKKRCNTWKEDTGWAFGLYSTPSESLCDRFCRLDQKTFGTHKGVTDRDYYTNSFHLDVEKQVSPMVKIDFESPYHKWASGGHISYVEIPNIQQDLRQVYIETVWDYAAQFLPYFGTNNRINKCHECGSSHVTATNGYFSCKACGNDNVKTLEVTERVCGYLGSAVDRPWIHGKQREYEGRVQHELKTYK